MRYPFNVRVRRFVIVVLTLCLLLTTFAPAPLSAQEKKVETDNRVRKANYDLAARWTTAKVGKMVFDTAVTPHWLETGDRFWYSYETSQGKKFYLVDPVRKTKNPLFDPAKMAAQLTTLTRIPYDAQHLPINTLRLVKKDVAFQFDINVPREADIPGLKKEEQAVATTATTPQGRGGQGNAAQGQPAPPPRPRTIYFEYDLASGKLSLLPDYEPPRKAR